MAKQFINLPTFYVSGKHSSPSQDRSQVESGPDLEEITCRICHGYGDILDEHTQKAKTCPACRGTGTI